MSDGARTLGPANFVVTTTIPGGEPPDDRIRGSLGVDAVARLRQVHGGRVVAVDGRPPASGTEGDALITDRRGVALCVVTADCVPLLLAGPGRVAAVHAGWRGIAGGVVAAALRELGEAGALRAYLGPAAGRCCYEVGEEVVGALVGPDIGQEWVLRRSGARPHVDLRERVRAELMGAGVDPAFIEMEGACTICSSAWPSYRREGAGAGRIHTAVAVA